MAIEQASPEAREWLERVKERREAGEEITHLFEVRCCGRRVWFDDEGGGKCQECGYTVAEGHILEAHGLDSIPLALENRKDNEARV